MKEKTKETMPNKLENYFFNLIRTDLFQKTISKLRVSYEIPEGGFKVDNNFYFSSNINKTPDEWKFNGSTEKITDIIQELNNLCKLANLSDWYWIRATWDYLFYNQVDFSKNSFKITPDNLCQISDVGQKINDFEIGKMSEDIEKHLNKRYPIILRISPYASERDIMSFIKENNGLIKFLQQEYSGKDSKIGKIRTKNQKKQERNDFIYEHRNLPLKKIFKLVSEKFDEVLDDGLIGKIISIETKRRKEV